jgi:hypothetical protein
MSRKEPQELPGGIEKPEPPPAPTLVADAVEFTKGLPAFALDQNEDYRILRCDIDGNVILAESAMTHLEEMLRKIAGEVVREEMRKLGLYPGYFGPSRAPSSGP